MERQRFRETVPCAGQIKIPNANLQAPEKFQAPSSIYLRANLFEMKYQKISSGAFLLSETPAENNAQRHAFDLEARTAKLGEATIRFCKKIPRGPENNRLIDQL